MKKTSNNPLYVVTMYKHGQRENHSYVLGVFIKKQQAIKAGEEEMNFRGKKYIHEIIECIPDWVSHDGCRHKIIVELKEDENFK